ncbi:MAG: glucose-6-phosphate dehydrogenase assembly protein OpcA [Myxococcales bacterium]
MIATGAASGAGPLELTARFDQGIDLAKIRALLAEVRERGGLPVEGVHTLNLVGIHFSQGAYERNQPAMEAASALHPARLIALIAEPRAAADAVVARVSTVRPPGSPLALERIVLTATGKGVRHLESALTGLLVPEVPLVAVWGGRPEGDLLRHAADAADRLIIDSGTRPLSALEDVARLLRGGAPVGDLAWARISPWQALAAEVLDLPSLREHRGRLQSARVTTLGAPGAEAALLAGWFAARVPKAAVELVSGPSGDPPSAGDVQELRFEAPPAVFTLRRDKGILVAEVHGDDDGAVLHRVRLPPAQPGRLLAMELKLLEGRDEIYAASVEKAARFAAWASGLAGRDARS